jgi:hypothetical protein
VESGASRYASNLHLRPNIPQATRQHNHLGFLRVSTDPLPTAASQPQLTPELLTDGRARGCGGAHTQFWVSQGKHWCEYCKCWMSNNQKTIITHNQGPKHKEAVDKRTSPCNSRCTSKFRRWLGRAGDSRARVCEVPPQCAALKCAPGALCTHTPSQAPRRTQGAGCMCSSGRHLRRVSTHRIDASRGGWGG